MELSNFDVRQLLFLTLISPRATHSTIIRELKTKIATFYFFNKKKKSTFVRFMCIHNRAEC